MSVYYEIEFDTPQAIEGLVVNIGSVAGIEAAYPSPIPISLSEIPSDDSACVLTAAYIDSQYYLRPPTQTLAGIDAFGAWQEACLVLQEAPPVIVGIHDNGFGGDPSWHPDLRGAIYPGSRASFSELGIHGTGVASVVGAANPYPVETDPCVMCRPIPTHAQGMLGVLPVARLLVSDRSSDLLGSLKYLIDSTPVRVINMSWGTQFRVLSLLALLDYAYFEKGIVLVAGSGNCEGSGPNALKCYDPLWPAAHPAVIAVGSIKPDRSDKSGFSNPGFQLLLAPGEDIFSAGGFPKSGGDTASINRGYSRQKGTSFSTPMVSAIAALLRQARLDISHASIADILASASTHRDRPFGWTRDMGYGLINARSAINAAIQTRCGNIPGDVNKDCYVNYGDVRMLSDYISALGPLTSPLNADVDSNCTIDVGDLGLLALYAFNGWPYQLKPGCLVRAPLEPTVEKLAVAGDDLPSLGSNYPNPFNPSTTIEFSVPLATDYTLKILNITGQEVARMSGRASIGLNKIPWDGSGMASGIYVYRLEVGSFSQSRKMVLLK